MDGRQGMALTSVGVVALSGGVALGYFLGLRKGKQTEVVYVHSNRSEPLHTVYSKVDSGENEIHVEEVEEPVPFERVISVFSRPDTEWDYEVEQSTREQKEAYVLHRDEYFNNEMGYRQSTVTYYKGDDILCDELDKPIYNYPHYIGDELPFGHGSGDDNVVYIRNDRERMEWEILLDNGRYEIEVLGLEINHEYEEKDLKHSVRRFVMD